MPPKCNVKAKDLLEADMENVSKNMELRKNLTLDNNGEEFKVKATYEIKKYIADNFEKMPVDKDGYISLVSLVRSIMR